MTLLAPARPIAKPRVGDLVAMLGTCRPHGSAAEHAFVTRFLLPLGVEADGFGNLWLGLGRSPILWSSHVDSCHRTGGTQDIVIEHGIARLADSSPSNCLGADCAAGIWLMREMILAGIEGTYVFHRGEERGGLGSAYAARHEAGRLAGLEAAVAFDRRGRHSIITHQRGSRSCSDDFAMSLAHALALGHVPDPTGTFTDTANYVDLIRECSNVSVGYDNEHSTAETLDIGYLLALREALLGADFGELAFRRQPGEREVRDWHDADLFDGWRPRRASLADLVRGYPSEVADFLEMHGVTARELTAFLDDDVPF